MSRSHQPLDILRQLREARRMSQTVAAQHLGLEGRGGRNQVSGWENGIERPSSRYRHAFVHYLGNGLDLRHDRERFEQVWQILEQSWQWPPLTEAEWQRHFGSVEIALPTEASLSPESVLDIRRQPEPPSPAFEPSAVHPIALHPPVTLTPQEQRNRDAMLRKVRQIWIAGLLEHSLATEVWLTLGLEERPNAVAFPLTVHVQELRRPPQALPVGTTIVDVFDGGAGTLLILGAPGAGKTTMLLELARVLLERATLDVSHPIPVVFNLASWTVQRTPLAAWLVDELHAVYDVPRRIAQTWVDQDQMLPLLDGLDEVQIEQRTACVNAINTFSKAHGLTPLVICSRTTDYDLLNTRLSLASAVHIRPLNELQIAAYLEAGGTRLDGLRQMLAVDTALCEIATSPLMLAIMTLIYRDLPADAQIANKSGETPRQQLFAAYVTEMFARRHAAHYPPEQTVRWLSWLAQELTDRSQRMILLEQLQPDWLPHAQRRWYAAGVSFLVGLIYGAIHAIAYAIQAGLVAGLLGGVIDGLVAGVITGFILGIPRVQRQLQRRGWQATRISMALGIGIAVLIGSTIGLVGSSVHPQTVAVIQQRFGFVAPSWGAGMIGGLYVSLQTGLAMGVIMAVVPSVDQITSVERLHWSWTQLRADNWRRTLPLLAGALGITLLIGLVLLLVGAWQYGIAATAILSLSMFLFTPFIIGSSMGVVETKTVPNQGMRRSAWHALIIGGGGGLLAGVVAGCVWWVVSTHVSTGITHGISIMLSVATMIGLAYGGLACIQHVVLRGLLWRSRVAPLRYAAFLDDCTKRIFLHRVGGGWIFVHRLLMEYFTMQGTE